MKDMTKCDLFGFCNFFSTGISDESYFTDNIYTNAINSINYRFCE